MESPSEQLEPTRAIVRRGPARAPWSRHALGGARPLGAQRFATTRWSLVLQAGAPDGLCALSDLCRAYWAPVHAFIRGYGLSREDAADVTQEFFENLLARNDLARADRERGRFRSWLRTCARNHLYNWFERRARRTTGGKAVHVSLESQGETALPDALIDAAHAERLYDRRWALTVVERALAQLRQRYEHAGKGSMFDALYAGLSGGACDEDDAQLARALGKSVGAIRVERHRLRARFRDYLKLEVAQTVAQPAEIEDELRRLFAALG